MKYIFLVVAFFLVFQGGYAAHSQNGVLDVKKNKNNFELYYKFPFPIPEAHIIRISKYRLNVQIYNSYKNSAVYLNDEEFGKTDKSGNFFGAIPSRAKGEQLLQVNKTEFKFNLDDDIVLRCKGKNLFCKVKKIESSK